MSAGRGESKSNADGFACTFIAFLASVGCSALASVGCSTAVSDASVRGSALESRLESMLFNQTSILDGAYLNAPFQKLISTRDAFPCRLQVPADEGDEATFVAQCQGVGSGASLSASYAKIQITPDSSSEDCLPGTEPSVFLSPHSGTSDRFADIAPPRRYFAGRLLERFGLVLPRARLANVRYARGDNMKHAAVFTESVHSMAERLSVARSAVLPETTGLDLEYPAVDRGAWWRTQFGLVLIGDLWWERVSAAKKHTQREKPTYFSRNAFWVPMARGYQPVLIDLDSSLLVLLDRLTEQFGKDSRVLGEFDSHAYARHYGTLSLERIWMNAMLHRLRKYQESFATENCEAECDKDLLSRIDELLQPQTKSEMKKWARALPVDSNVPIRAAEPALDPQGKEQFVHFVDTFYEVLEARDYLRPATRRTTEVRSAPSSGTPNVCTAVAGTLVYIDEATPRQGEWTFVEVSTGDCDPSRTKGATGWVKAEDIYVP